MDNTYFECKPSYNLVTGWYDPPRRHDSSIIRTHFEINHLYKNKYHEYR
jgi:hypothetical protein